MKTTIFTLIFLFLPLSPMTVGAEPDGRYEIRQSFEAIPIKDNPDFITGYKVSYDTTDLWLENGIDTIECWWEPKIVGYRADTIVMFTGDSLFKPTFIYAYPPDSVLKCDTTWMEETSINVPDTTFPYIGDSTFVHETDPSLPRFFINPDRYWFLNRLNSRRIDPSKIMHPDAVIVKKFLPDEYEIDSTDVTDLSDVDWK